MSWHYFQGPEVVCSEVLSSDGDPSAALSSPPFADKSYLDVSRTAACRSFRSGTISGLLTDGPGVEELTSCLADFLARPSQRSHTGDKSPPIYGPRCCELFEKSSPPMSSQRTLSSAPSRRRRKTSRKNITWLTALEFPPPAWVPQLDGHGIGWLPTRTTEMNHHQPSMQKHAGCKRLMTLTGKRGRMSPLLAEALMGWPIGWTDCESSAMARYLPWLCWHGHYYRPRR